MKIREIVFIIAIVFGITACTSSAKDYIEVYEEGTEKVISASSQGRLAQITQDVNEKLSGLDNRLGKAKATPSDVQKVHDAQNKFYEAVEKRDKELSK